MNGNTKKWFFMGIASIILVFGLIMGSCDNLTNETPNEHLEVPESVDSAFWFGEIYDSLINEIGNISSEDYKGDMAEIADCTYVCSAINNKWGTAFTPEAGTEIQAANCEYLLKMIDKANHYETNFGTSAFATTQVVNKTGVNAAVNLLWMPNGKFVAVANNSNKTAYSLDGITWTAATMPSSAVWESVTYGNGKFVAVASNNYRAAYSTDGITWTAATMPSAVWISVTYGNGKFVAVANLNGPFNYSNRAAYSTDGITWTAATLPSVAAWESVTYGNGKFVTVTFDSNKTAYSLDGITWTAATLPSSVSWYGVTYGNGKFVAVTFDSDKAAYSTDGITWTATTLPSSAQWARVTYGNGKFVAVAYNDNSSGTDKAAYSTDGITWTAATLPSSVQWYGVTYSGD
jgi:hypothetical protein